MRDALLNDAGPVVVDLREVSKRFTLRRNRASSVKERALAMVHPSRREVTEDFWALRQVSVAIRAGEAVGFIGRNGSGKSTLLRLIAGILRPTHGTVRVPRGARMGTMIELGIGFHGELSARENVYLNAAIHGLTRADIDAVYDDIVAYSGLEHFMDQPVKNFSSGMSMRLGFSISVSLKPDILLLDEIFAVGDADFHPRCVETMRQFRARGGTLVFVSHSADTVRQICDRTVVLDSGAVVFDGPVEEGLSTYAGLAARHGEVLPGSESRTAPALWHHAAIGGHWAEMGPWALAFLTAEGLQPDQFVLDVGCGSLPVALHLLPYMAPGHYWGYDPSRELFNAGIMLELTPRGVDATRGHFLINDRFDLSGSPHRFHMALAHSLLPRLLGDQFGPCLAAVLDHLAPGGRFYLAVGPRTADGRRSAIGQLVEQLSGACHARLETRPNAGHPRGDEIMVLIKQ